LSIATRFTVTANGPQEELEGADAMGSPLREEHYMHLPRLARACKINPWSEHPPARTHRMVECGVDPAR
jgi:hypothetical protein